MDSTLTVIIESSFERGYSIVFIHEVALMTEHACLQRPSDSTHYQHDACLAKWYKQIDGVWFYWAGAGYWMKSANTKCQNRKLVRGPN